MNGESKNQTFGDVDFDEIPKIEASIEFLKGHLERKRRFLALYEQVREQERLIEQDIQIGDADALARLEERMTALQEILDSTTEG